jgi:hypothetical protein
MRNVPAVPRAVLTALALVVARVDAANLVTTPRVARLDAVDLRGRRVGAERLRGHVTFVTLSTRDAQPRAMRLGQEAAARFGDRPGYQSLTLANTSKLSFVLRPLAPGTIEAAEREAVETALARQHERGKRDVTEEDVRQRVIFVHDTDGSAWRSLGVDPATNELHVAVIDAAASLVYLAREPVDEAELFAVVEEQLQKLANSR